MCFRRGVKGHIGLEGIKALRRDGTKLCRSGMFVEKSHIMVF